MGARNEVNLIGNLGNDPEVTLLESGAKVAKISIATKEVFRDKNGEIQTITDWHQVEFWGRNADVSEKYLHKGSEVTIKGKLKTISWDDKEGNKRYKTFVQGTELIMHGKRDSTNTQESQSQSNAADDSKPPF